VAWMDNIPCSSSSSGLGWSLPNTPAWAIAFSNSAFPYEKYRSAVSGASSPAFDVLWVIKREIRSSGRVNLGRDAIGGDYAQDLEGSCVKLDGLFVLAEGERAFGLLNRAFEGEFGGRGGSLLSLSFPVITGEGLSRSCGRWCLTMP